jgi:ribonuclease P protein component
MCAGESGNTAFELAWPHAQAARSSSGAGHAGASGCPPETPLHRRNRLSRSRDFDAVYRQGRSVSTRFLVLYSFPREPAEGEPRLGLAVPKETGTAARRNRIKRQLREAWSSLEPTLGQDYVLIVRPGLAEAAESRGYGWLRERVDEVMRKAAA